jgi:hypothetical protein
MREAIGGALLIKLVLFFVAVYVCFLSIAINYSITFRVKNQIINLIESYEGVENATPYIEKYIADVGYYRTTVGSVAFNNPGCQSGYCIYKEDAVRGYYYRVTTYVSFSFPIIGPITQFPVTGETKVIYEPI